jgi:hypothetical protein
VIGLFAWGYFVTVKNTSWNAGKDVTNIAVFVGNCFVNVSQSDNQLQVLVCLLKLVHLQG